MTAAGVKSRPLITLTISVELASHSPCRTVRVTNRSPAFPLNSTVCEPEPVAVAGEAPRPKFQLYVAP